MTSYCPGFANKIIACSLADDINVPEAGLTVQCIPIEFVRAGKEATSTWPLCTLDSESVTFIGDAVGSFTEALVPVLLQSQKPTTRIDNKEKILNECFILTI